MTTLDTLISLLQASFIQRAFIIGVIIAILSSLISIFVVLKRVSLIGDGLAHTAFGGLAVGYFLNLTPLWVAAPIVVLGSIGITKATRSRKISSDAAVAVFLTLGLSAGITLISITRALSFDIESLLFGSILLVTDQQIYVALGILATTLAVIFLFFKELLYTTFDETQARASGIRTWLYDYMISVLTGIVVIASIPIVGVLLIAALIVLPALTSIQVTRSFKQTIVVSPLFALASVLVGLFLSLVLDAAPGGTIVLSAIGIFALVLLIDSIRKWTLPESVKLSQHLKHEPHFSQEESHVTRN